MKSRISKLASAWDNEYLSNQLGLIYEPLWRTVSDCLLSVSTGQIIDFGCGDGRYSFLLNDMGFDVLGIDISSKAIKLAKKIQNERSIEAIQFTVNDGIPNQIPDNSINAVVMFNTYHCLTSSLRKIVINSVSRVLTQQGLLILSTLTLEDESYPRNKWIEIASNTYNDRTGKLFHFFSKDELVLELHSFKITSIEKLENIVPSVGKKSSLYVVFAMKK
jgi:ubiquinone/menaquinone biosynthesis C-methylase UbiE